MHKLWRVTLIVGLIVVCLFGWLWRAALANWAICAAIRVTQYDPVRAQGVALAFPPPTPPWSAGILMGDLSSTLSEVLGRPMRASVYTRIAAALPGRGWSCFQDPDSPYYQVWVGAYVVLDGAEGQSARQHFGLDGQGQPVLSECLALFEADQRLALPWAGCANHLPDAARVRGLTETFLAERATVAGQACWKVSGVGETWALFHHGRTPAAAWPVYWFMGSVPRQQMTAVDDYPALRYHGVFYLCYEPALRASVVRFYIYPEYRDTQERQVEHGVEVIPTCEAVVSHIRLRSAARDF